MEIFVFFKKEFREFFRRMFLEEFFSVPVFLAEFFGGIFWEDILGGILCLNWNWLVCQEFGFCQDFVSMEKEEEEGQEFGSLEVRRKLIALKKVGQLLRLKRRSCLFWKNWNLSLVSSFDQSIAIFLWTICTSSFNQGPNRISNCNIAAFLGLQQ